MKTYLDHRVLLPWLALSFCFCLAFCSVPQLSAQDKSPEFPKGFTGYLYLQQGLVSNFQQDSPRHYQVGLSARPEFTLVPRRLRLGLQAQVLNAKNTWQYQFGPTASLRLADWKAGVFGTAANVQLTAGHLWGSYGQRLIGGGLQAEFFQAVALSLSAYRDYGQQQWWLQTSIGVNLLLKKRAESTDPFD